MTHRSVAENAESDFTSLTGALIGSCIEVHRELGPGLLESSYEEALAYELENRKIAFQHQVGLPVTYKNQQLSCGYRLDFVAEGSVILELKAVEQLLPIHKAQCITYLRHSGLTLALLINFNVPVLKQSIQRIILSQSKTSVHSVSLR